MTNSFLFGPVPSRRLGVSLGIDLVPHKTCSLNCVYCECGKTTELTLERKEYVPTQAIIDELREYLSRTPPLDYITFAGSGEPCLHNGLGTIVTFLKKEFPSYKTALLTNGTLLYLKEVRDAIMPIDLVLPSLDAVLPQTFRKVNRPHPSLDLKRTIEGLVTFAKEYKGEILLEIFIIPDINDTPEELSAFKEIIKKITPARTQLNTLDRPGACSRVVPASRKRLEEIAEYFAPLKTEIIARQATRRAAKPSEQDLSSIILALLKRRPCTIEDLAAGTGANTPFITKTIAEMEAGGLITQRKTGDHLFNKVK
ncbi:MAG: radical SAM protein [Chitinivibrionales bacterium]|nr:radical SAM protein [Chitinivibrionales bacterium]